MNRDDLEMKTFGAFEVKDAEKGEVTAIVAVFNAVDRDRDVILPGAFADGTPVQISAHEHSLARGEAPAGKGTVHIDGDKGILRGRFFLSTDLGREAFHTVKEMGQDYQWSVAWPKHLVQTTPMTKEWQAKGARRLITGLPIVEASPVFIGAGIGTGTVDAKALDAEAEAQRQAAADALKGEFHRIRRNLRVR